MLQYLPWVCFASTLNWKSAQFNARSQLVAEWFSSGRVADGILAFMLIEAIVLIIVRKKTGRGLRSLDLFLSLAAGAALLLALRAALTGVSWIPIALWLLVALPAHLWDLRRRWLST